jgi:hypothetical protein
MGQDVSEYRTYEFWADSAKHTEAVMKAFQKVDLLGRACETINALRDTGFGVALELAELEAKKYGSLIDIEKAFDKVKKDTSAQSKRELEELEREIKRSSYQPYAARQKLVRLKAVIKDRPKGVDTLMVSGMLFYLALNGGPTSADDASAKKMGRVTAVIYKLFGGQAETKVYQSLGFKVARIMNCPPEEAIALLTDSSSVIAGAAAAALG